MPLPLLASTKLKNRTFILLYLIYICTVFLYYLNHCRVGYVRLKTPLNEVDTYTFLHYMRRATVVEDSAPVHKG